MKHAFSLTLALTVLSSVAALACIDPGAELIPTKAALDTYKDNGSFVQCIDQLREVGVKLSAKTTYVFRKEREKNSTDPIIYQLLFTGKDAKKSSVRLLLNYDLRGHRFTCADGVSYQIPRGGCF